MENIKYILYARKSSESEDRQVLSIESQIEELKKLAEKEDLEILEIIHESKSAKEPGRPGFNEMIKKIDKGIANGILCWKLDRLARNAVDGGTIIWRLQNGILKEIRTVERKYLPNDNVLMMYVELGMANQFIKDLSINTKRGLRKKCELGYKPGLAPLGYINDKISSRGNRGYFPDPERLPIIRKIFQTLATGLYTPKEVYKMAVNEWGLTNRNGKKLSISKFYALLRTPDYYGEFEYPEGSGNWYKGSYEPAIDKETWLLVQNILNKKGFKKQRKFIHLFRGLLKCGECGAVLTSYEKIKINKKGEVRKYVYYECSTKKNYPKLCRQKPIREEALENEILKLLSNVYIPKEIHEWAINALKEKQRKNREERKKTLAHYQKEYSIVINQIDRLILMKSKREITDDEFERNIKALRERKEVIENVLRKQEYEDDRWIDYALDYINIISKIKEAYLEGDLATKRTILKCIGSEFIVKDKQFFIKLEPVFEVRIKNSFGVLMEYGIFEPAENSKNVEFNKDSEVEGENYSSLLRGQDSNLRHPG